MSQDSFRVKRSLNVQPLASPSLTEQGDIGVNSSTGKIQYNNGTTTSPVVTESHTATLTNKTIDADLNTISNLVDASIKAGAAIAYSKLNLSNSIVNADIASAAAIAYSKLSLSNSIVNADIASAAAIAYSKLALSNSIVNADIATGANIDVAKLGALTASRALETNGSGVITPSTVTSTELGYLSGVTSSIQTQLGNKADTSALTAHTGASSGVHGVTGSVVGTSDTQTLTNKTLDAPVIDNGADFIEEATLSSPASGRRRLGLKTDGKLYLRDSSGNEVAVGTGSGGGINYILNPDAEANTTGWNTYNDSGEGSTTQPVNGTGGSANITFTRDTTTPLRNTAQFLLTKDAANRQGQGISYDFTIDRADQAKRLVISFDYLIASGTYADGDIGVYIVDVTNGTVIQPAGFQVQNINGVAAKEIAVFQTAGNSTSYRLCLHVASTSTSAYTLRIDNVQVGPVDAQIVQTRGPVGSVIAHTSLTPPTGYLYCDGSAVSRSLYSQLFAVIGTTYGAGDGSTTFNLPDARGLFLSGAGSQTLNTITYSRTLGTRQNDAMQSHRHGYSRSQATTLSSTATGQLSDASPNLVATGTAIGPPTVDGANGTPRTDVETRPANIAVAYHICFSSGDTQVVSDSSEGRVVASYVNRTGSNFAMSAGGATFRYYTAVMNNTVVDTVGGATLSGSDTAYTVRTPGVYDVEFSARIEAGATAVVNQLILELNGSAVSNAAALTGTGLAHSILSTVDPDGRTAIVRIRRRFNAGDVIRPQIFRYSNTSQNMVLDASWFSVALIQGSQTLLGGETVAATYVNFANSGTVDSSTGNTILWSTRVQDTHNMVNTSTGVITAPVSGRYRIACQISCTFSATTAALTARIFGPSNTIIREVSTHSGATVTGGRLYSAFVEAEVPLLAGQTASVRGLAVFGSATYLQDGTVNYLHVTRVGNY